MSLTADFKWGMLDAINKDGRWGLTEGRLHALTGTPCGITVYAGGATPQDRAADPERAFFVRKNLAERQKLISWSRHA